MLWCRFLELSSGHACKWSHLNLLWYWTSSLHSDTRGRKHQQLKWRRQLLSELLYLYCGLDTSAFYAHCISSKSCCGNWNNIGFCHGRESDITKERIQKILASGANVILTTGGIDDMCLKYFVDVGAMAVRRVLKRDLKRIAKATGGRMKICCYLWWFIECKYQGNNNCPSIFSHHLPLFDESGGRGVVWGHHAGSGWGGCAGTHLWWWAHPYQEVRKCIEGRSPSCFYLHVQPWANPWCVLTALVLFFPYSWSCQYQSTYVCIHRVARGQRLYVRRDGAFAARCPLCGQEGAGVEICRSWWRRCGGSSVNLPWELRHKHGETFLPSSRFVEHSPVVHLCWNIPVTFVSSGFQRAAGYRWVCSISPRHPQDAGCERSTGLHWPGGQASGLPQRSSGQSGTQEPQVVSLASLHQSWNYSCSVSSHSFTTAILTWNRR